MENGEDTMPINNTRTYRHALSDKDVLEYHHNFLYHEVSNGYEF
jgi:hypothetical protein